MRLNEDERRHIAAAASTVLPPGSRVSLFGSRTDDAQRGGDVDLLVELPVIPSAEELHRLRSLLTVQLYRRMGERRIDIVMTDLGTADDRLIVSEARRQALELVQT
jgi:predicted nucleotidyltransferase